MPRSNRFFASQIRVRLIPTQMSILIKISPQRRRIMIIDDRYEYLDIIFFVFSFCPWEQKSLFGIS